MCESDKLHDEINVIDIKIYPNRFLKPKTTELLLNKICGLEGYVRFLIHGPSLPKKVFYVFPINKQAFVVSYIIRETRKKKTPERKL